MACQSCQQARSRAIQAARSFNLAGVASAVSDAVAINADKLRGLSQEEINSKYGGNSKVRVATPYVRSK